VSWQLLFITELGHEWTMNAFRMLSRVVLDFAAAAFFSTSRREPVAEALLLPLHLL
jgi:hypothetical protein